MSVMINAWRGFSVLKVARGIFIRCRCEAESGGVCELQVTLVQND